MTATEFIKKLKTYRSPEELKKIQRYFKTGAMPRTALRYAIEHLDKKQRDYYMGLKKEG